MERKQQHEKLINEWMEARPAYDDEAEFVWDGPSNWDKYYAEKPRILFLLKESRLGYHPASPENNVYGIRGHNVIRWAYLIKALYENRDTEVKLPDDETLKSLCNNNYHHIAEVELKKRNDEFESSIDSDIWSYSKNDAQFLKRQIEIIDPEVIICCGNFYSYKTIYDGDTEQPLLIVNGEKQSYKHRNRLVIDFHHPSYAQLPGGNEAHLRLLHQALENGKVFSNFNW